MKKYNKGFTLIELLVVIAIIGILASIILVSLSAARNKGKDASATGSISSIRAAAEIYYDSSPNSYAGVCGDTDVRKLVDAANDQTGGAHCVDDSNGTAYIAYTTLVSDGAHDFCVDSTGYAGKVLSSGSGENLGTWNCIPL